MKYFRTATFFSKKLFFALGLGVILALVFCIPNTYASTLFTASVDGNWNDGATWGNISPGVEGTDFPGATDDASLVNGVSVTLTQHQSLHNVTISTSSSLTLGAYTITVGGNWTNNGTLNANTSTAVFTGTNQIILGANTFHNFTKTVSSADTLYLDPTATTTITGVLNLGGATSNLLTIKGAMNRAPEFLRQWGSRWGSGSGQLSGPHGIVRDSLGNIYIADSFNERVEKFNSTGEFVDQFALVGGKQPYSIAIDNLDNIYALIFSTSIIQKFNSDGVYQGQLGSAGSGDGQWNNPQDLAIDLLGNLYIADGNGRVMVVNSLGEYQRKWSTGVGQFNFIRSIAVSTSTGNVYVGDSGRIQVFNSLGVYQTSFGQGLLSSPSRISFDASGNIYVTDNSRNSVYKFNSAGVFQFQFGSYGSGDGQLINPFGVIISTSTGQHLVIDYGNNRVSIHDSLGNFVSSFGNNRSYGGQYNSPDGIAYDSSGKIYVMDTYGNRLQKFDADSNFLWTSGWGVGDGSSVHQVCTVAINCKSGLDGSGDGQLDSAHNVVIDPASGHILVSDNYNHRVQIFDSDGNFVSKFGTSGTAESQFNQPYGLAYDASGHLYVVDGFNYRVQKFNVDGSFNSMFGFGVSDGSNTFQKCTSSCQVGLQGSGNGQFDRAHGIAIDSEDNIYISDTQNNRIQVFNSNHDYVTKFGSTGTAEGQFDKPLGMVFDSLGNLYVADNHDNNRIQKFDSDHNFLVMWGWGVEDGSNELQSCTSGCQAGTNGHGDGQLNAPHSLVFDSEGNLSVSNYFDYTIQVFAPSSDTWNIDAQGTVNASYLNVVKSNSVSSLTCSVGCTDGGGSTNWIFPVVATPTPTPQVSYSGSGGGGYISTPSPSLTPTALTSPSVKAPTPTPQPFVNCPKGYVCTPVAMPNATPDIKSNSKSNTDGGGVFIFTFTRDLKLGDEHSDVKELQTFLNNNGYVIAQSGLGSPGKETITFGRLTEKALKLLQSDNSLNPVGAFGPKTRALVNKMLLNLNTSSTEVTPTPTAKVIFPKSELASTFTRDLELGSEGDDVKLLQQYLNTHGFTINSSGIGSPGNESTYFGNATKAALMKFQKANNLPSTGYFGTMTRAVVTE